VPPTTLLCVAQFAGLTLMRNYVIALLSGCKCLCVQQFAYKLPSSQRGLTAIMIMIRSFAGL